MDNLEEIDRLLEQFNLPRLNQEEIEIMSNPIKSTENETVIKTLKKKKTKKKQTKQNKTQKPRTRWLQKRILSNI